MQANNGYDVYSFTFITERVNRQGLWVQNRTKKNLLVPFYMIQWTQSDGHFSISSPQLWTLNLYVLTLVWTILVRNSHILWNILQNLLRYIFHHICRNGPLVARIYAKHSKGMRNPTLVCGTAILEFEVCALLFFLSWNQFDQISNIMSSTCYVRLVNLDIYPLYPLPLLSFFVSLHYWDAFVRAISPTSLHSLANNFDVRFIWCIFSFFQCSGIVSIIASNRIGSIGDLFYRQKSQSKWNAGERNSAK